MADGSPASPDQEPTGPSGTVTVLGCDGSYPGPGGAASGYLVRSAGTTLWLDAGPGSFANLQALDDPRQVDAIVLSHEHPDHWTDLESFAVWRMHLEGASPAPVYAPPGLRDRPYFAESPVLAWQTVESSDEVQVGGLVCRFAATDHGPPTLAVRIDRRSSPGTDPARALAYTADTGPAWSVEELGTGLGLVLCEASYTRELEGRFRHLSGRQAGAMAAGAEVLRLVLTHRWPTVSAVALAAEAGETFGGTILQARAGVELDW